MGMGSSIGACVRGADEELSATSSSSFCGYQTQVRLGVLFKVP